MVSFVLFSTIYRREMTAAADAAKEIKRFQDEAPRELLSIKESTSKYALIIMALNSPWMVCFSSILVIALVALGKLTRVGLYQDTQEFVENIELEPSLCPQAA